MTYVTLFEVIVSIWFTPTTYMFEMFLPMSISWSFRFYFSLTRAPALTPLKSGCEERRNSQISNPWVGWTMGKSHQQNPSFFIVVHRNIRDLGFWSHFFDHFLAKISTFLAKNVFFFSEFFCFVYIKKKWFLHKTCKTLWYITFRRSLIHDFCVKKRNLGR